MTSTETGSVEGHVLRTGTSPNGRLKSKKGPFHWEKCFTALQDELSQDPLHHIAVYIRQPELPALETVCKSGVIYAT